MCQSRWLKHGGDIELTEIRKQSAQDHKQANQKHWASAGGVEQFKGTGSGLESLVSWAESRDWQNHETGEGERRHRRDCWSGRWAWWWGFSFVSTSFNLF